MTNLQKLSASLLSSQLWSPRNIWIFSASFPLQQCAAVSTSDQDKIVSFLRTCQRDKIFSAKTRDFQQIGYVISKTKYMYRWLWVKTFKHMSHLNHLIPIIVLSYRTCKCVATFPFSLPSMGCLQVKIIMVLNRICLLLTLKKCW